MAVLREDSIIGHVPRNLSPRLFHFLRRDVNNAFAEVTGQKVNRGPGCRLWPRDTMHLSLVYTVHLLIIINKMKELVKSLAASGHI